MITQIMIAIANWWARVSSIWAGNIDPTDKEFYAAFPWIMLLHAHLGQDGHQIAPEYYETEKEAIESLAFPDNDSEDHFYILLDAQLISAKEYDKYRKENN
jgi:hypothetical protein